VGKILERRGFGGSPVSFWIRGGPCVGWGEKPPPGGGKKKELTASKGKENSADPAKRAVS